MELSSSVVVKPDRNSSLETAVGGTGWQPVVVAVTGTGTGASAVPARATVDAARVKTTRGGAGEETLAVAVRAWAVVGTATGAAAAAQ